MPLIVGTLQARLLLATQNLPRNARAAASTSAAAFAQYAKTATVGVAVPAYTLVPGGDAPKREAFAATLYAAYANARGGNMVSFASAWSRAVLTFWLTTQFVTVPLVDAGIPIPTPGADAAFIAGVSELGSRNNTSALAMMRFAALVDAYSRSFIVTLLPSGTTLPIT